MTSICKFEGFFIELAFNSKILFSVCSYNPKISKIIQHLQEIQINLYELSQRFNKAMLMGSLNSQTTDAVVKEIGKYRYDRYCESSYIFNNSAVPTSIDHMLTNKPNGFHKTTS